MHERKTLEKLSKNLYLTSPKRACRKRVLYEQGKEGGELLLVWYEAWPAAKWCIPGEGGQNVRHCSQPPFFLMKIKHAATKSTWMQAITTANW